MRSARSATTWNRTFLVARREFTQHVRTKGFWIGLLILPVLLVVSMVVPVLLEKTKGPRRFAVIDQSGWLLAAVEERAAAGDAQRLMRRLRGNEPEHPGVEAWPPALAGLVPAVKAAPEGHLPALARLLAASDGSRLAAEALPDGLTPETAAAFRAGRAEYFRWWSSLPGTAAAALKASLSRAEYVRRDTPPGADAESVLRDELQRKGDGLFAYFVIGPDPLDPAGRGHKYVSNNFTDDSLKGWFSRLATEEIQARRFAREGVAADVVRRIEAPFVFDEKQVSAGGVEKAVATQDVLRQWAPVAFVYLLWISIYSMASSLMTSTIEEKSSRIIEVLLSSVSPLELMRGKILGTAATGLTMVGTWVVFFLAALKALPRLFGGMGGIDLTVLVRDPVYIASFVTYFLLGFLLYASLLVGIGAVCTSLQEAQNLMGPVTILLILPLIAMVPVGKDPNGLLARVLSFIPPFTPFTMMNRAAGPPALWEYVATTLLLVATIALAARGAAKVFRIGILMTGKPPRLREILRWVRTPVA